MTDNDEAATTFTERDLVSLGEKLATLELTDPERAALGALLSDDDVSGFGQFDLIKPVKVGLRAEPSPFGVRYLDGDSASLGIRVPQPGTTKPGRF